MFYLTGDGRLCAYTIVSRNGKVAMGVPLTDVDDVRQNAYFDHITGFENEVGMIHSIADHFKELEVTKGTVGLEYTFLTQSMMSMMTHPHAKPENVGVVDCTHIMSNLRLVKDSDELKSIKAAAEVADKGIEAAIASLKPNMTESQVAAEAEYTMRQTGAENFWRTYVSSGQRTTIAHGIPTTRKIQKGEMVMIDVHPIVQGYSADTCRTVCVGKPNKEQQSGYNAYFQAQQAAVEKAREGVKMEELEETIHRILKESGHGEHTFGPPIHGVGIEFEEAPLPSGHAFFHGEKSPSPLNSNTVIAIGNCGLYTGKWGVRVEDTVVIGKTGPEVLTNHPRVLKS
jgi:Xaa-Pro aminopeptidase